jgi:hypothetical protein
MVDGFSDGLSWCKAIIGINGCTLWIKGGRDTALYLFRLFQADAGQLGKVPGSRISGASVVTYGPRTWQAAREGAGKAKVGRWVQTVLGEVNERNAGQPPQTLDYIEHTGVPIAGPPPIVKKRCGRLPQVLQRKQSYNTSSLPPNQHIYVNFEIEEGFQAKQLEIRPHLLDVHGNDYGGAISLINYPILNAPVIETDIDGIHGPLRVVDPLDDGTINVIRPGMFPVEGHATLLRSYDYAIKGYPQPDPNFKPGPDRIGKREIYTFQYSVFDNWVNADVWLLEAEQLGAGGLAYVEARFVYSSAPDGYALTAGNPANIPLIPCMFKAPPQQADRKCKEGFFLENDGKCLVFRTCDANRVASDFEICTDGGDKIGLPIVTLIKSIIRSRAEDGGTNGLDITIKPGGYDIEYTDSSGYQYPVIKFP